MTTEYILDLDKEEYRDDFVSNENNEFWQFEARDSLIEKLTTTLNEAKSYKIARQKNPNKTWLSHNAILVSGQRGTGKTVFLRNCEDIWNNSNSNNASHEQRELYFLHEIDPTMLINEDNFSNVVVAQIYSEVERKLQSESFCKNSNTTLEQNKNTFHKALKKLADSLGKLDDFNGFTGIDKIQQYKSGIHIQTYFNEFIEAAINILDCSALVLPIDDVDMALDRAFEVVDDVRRLLGCPYIIPIVSGDYRLYSQMTNVHFDEKSYRDKPYNEGLRDEGQELAKQLSNAYLTKVFPNQMRITLLPITYIIPTLIIKQKDDENFTEYKDYKNSLLRQFYPLCNNNEAIDNWPEPESARELTQLIRAMTPKRFDEVLSDSENSSKANYKLWKSYINWAEQKQNGVAFTNANSYLSLVNSDSSGLFDIQELANFNPKQQMIKELYPWAKKDFYNSQIKALGYTNTPSDDKLLKVIKSNRAILDTVFDQNSFTLRSMPPIEFIDNKSYVAIETIDKDISGANKVNISLFLSNYSSVSDPENINNEGQTKTPAESDIEFTIEQVLFDLYTHGDIYSTLSNNFQYVFMSRAFEIIFYSFVKSDNSKTQKNNLLHILRKPPFYSVFNMASTKAILSEEEENVDLLNVSDVRPELEQNDDITSEVLSRLIQEWKSQHQDFFSSFDSKLLVTIFAYMFNKTFTALNIFKQEVFSKGSFGRKTKTNEHLTDFAKRFEYMLINSAYTAAIQGVAVQANVAFTDNHNTIRSASAFNSSDRVLKRNRDRFDQEMKPESDVKFSASNVDAALFIKALEDHPIFKLIQINDKDKGIIIPEKIKMGKAENKGSLPFPIFEEVKSFLKAHPEISKNGVNTFESFQNRLLDCTKPTSDNVLAFYKDNRSLLREIYNRHPKSIKGNKEHNFIIALIIVMDAHGE